MSVESPELREAARMASALHARRDVVERLETCSVLPIASQWMLVRGELENAANEIRRLRRRIEELEGDGT